ncbi:paeninodin family lasso peptide [Metabacillus sp. 84]
MKKVWEKPTLEVLDVNETLLGRDGDFTDAAFDPNTPKGKLTFS